MVSCRGTGALSATAGPTDPVRRHTAAGGRTSEANRAGARVPNTNSKQQPSSVAREACLATTRGDTLSEGGEIKPSALASFSANGTRRLPRGSPPA